LVISIEASIPADSLGEGTTVGYLPIPADTVSDTSFHIGDTLFLDNGKISVKIADSKKEEVVIPSTKTTVKLVVGDGFTHGKVTQVFKNPFDLPFDATYVFPLPNDGAVHAMEFRTSFGIYHADLMKKKVAETVFDSLKTKGMQASLLTQVSDNIFIQKICNIPARDSVKVTITYSSPIPYDMGKYDLNFPATIAEDRYGKKPLGPVVSFPHERPGASLEFYILLMTPYQIQELVCPTYNVVLQNNIPVQTAINLGILDSGATFPVGINTALLSHNSSNATVPNNDIVVRYSRVKSELDISVLSSHNGSKGYLAMQIFPDLHDSGQIAQAIDMVFILDKSGSMSGNPIILARETVHKMLNMTRNSDRISLLAYDSRQYALFPEPVPATQENVAKAHNWIDELNASGGTEMMTGVKKALSIPLDPERKRIIALITDGEIYGVDAIYQAIKNDTSDNTVFAFAIGRRTNQELIDGAAEAGNGIGSHIVNKADVEPTVSKFWKRIRMPQISNLSINWGSTTLPTDIVGSDMGNLWFGQPIKLFAKYTVGGPRTITLSGVADGNPVSGSYNINLVSNNNTLRGVSKMWAREVIEYWMHEQISAGNEMNKDKITEISLAHNVLCKYTAFLAVADSIYDKKLEKWVSAEEYFINKSKNNEENIKVHSKNASHATKLLLSEKEFTFVKPGLILLHNGNKIEMKLHGIPSIHVNGFITIYDLKGRVIMKWSIAQLAKNNFRWTWNKTDKTGKLITRGFYILSVKNSFFKMSKKLQIK
jgi:Ca-activated chloride channel family protein